MTANSLAALRKAKKISRATLGETVGLSAVHIRLIENGYVVKLAYAKEIAMVLGEALSTVFPSAAVFGDKLDRADGESLVSIGLDSDILPNCFRFLLKSGADRTVWVSGGERQRLERLLENSGEGFVEFNTPIERIAINTAHLCAWQFHDFGAEPVDLSSFRDQPKFKLWLAHSKEPVTMQVDHDSPTEDEDHALLRVFAQLNSDGDPECVKGTEGEVIYFKPRDVAMLSVDLAAVEPQLIDGWNEDDDKMGQAA